jgi:hypothetical protein
MTAKKSGGSTKSAAKTGSATTSRTGQVGAAQTKVTPVQDDGKNNDKATAGLEHENPQRAEAGSKAAAKEAPARKGHAVGTPRKSMEAKFGPKNPDIAETARRQAALGGI